MGSPFLFPESEIKTDYTPKPSLQFSCKEDLDNYHMHRIMELRARTDITFKEKYAIYGKSKHWKNLRRKKLEFSKVCQRCKSPDYINVHHVNYKSWYDCTVDDLEILCESCHLCQHAYKKGERL